MDRETRNLLERTTQQARRLLEAEYGRLLEGTFDILPDGTIHAEPGGHLSPEERFFRGRLVAAIEHRRALGESAQDSVANFLRECAFTFLNRTVALRMLEARDIIKPSVSKGEESSGFTNEFLLLAPGLKSLPDKGYRLYLESLFDEIGREIGVLFDRSDFAGQLWPDRPKLLDLLNLLNNPGLEAVWGADETIGWVYQYFNSDDERRQMRADSPAPRNSREMAVRNQFFTPRYVVEFLTDNTLGRTWYEMQQGQTLLKERCRFLVRRPNEHFLQPGEVPAQVETRSERTQEEILREGMSIPYRAPKDPREIRVLDPACGSGHFLLYCFDLLEVIYEEAWEAGIGTLRKEYSDKADLKRAVPELILRHNLHGIDIDPRAAQIGSLALWMRAQRAWNKLTRAERPAIRKTNIVVAEPMPGEADLLDEFCESLEPKLLGQLVRDVFKRMKVAGDAGSLLRIETDIADMVEEAKRQWLAEEAPTDRHGNPLLFAKSRQRTIFEMERVTVDFWAYAEQQVVDALHRFATTAANGPGFRRRLFADDAERGFAFIDLCRNRFDVMLMNPPFGAASLPSKDYVDQSYGDTKGDVYKAFVEGAYDRLVSAGMLGIISSRMGFFLSQSQDWRKRVVLRLFRPFALADLGEGVLDAMVETAAYALRRIDEDQELNLTLELVPTLQSMLDAGEEAFSIPAYSRKRAGLKRHQALQEIAWLEEAKLIREISGGVRRFEILGGAVKGVAAVTAAEPPALTCIQLLRLPDKEGRLQDSLHRLAFEGILSQYLFIAHHSSFTMVPGSPFAYWVDNSIRALFRRFPPFEGNGRRAKQGLATADDFRFVRAWWEVPVETLLTGEPNDPPDDFRRRTHEGKRWTPFAKGGRYSPYYADVYLVLNWGNDGDELKAWAESLPGCSHWSRRIASSEFYFRPGLTWPRRSQRGFSLRPCPRGAIFADKGPVASCEAASLPVLLGIGNSPVFHALLSLQMAFGSYEVGVFQRTPVPDLHDQRIALDAQGIAELKRLQDSTQELSHVFRLPALLLSTASSLSERLADLESRRKNFETEIAARQAAIGALSASLYGIPPPTEEKVGEDPVSAPDADEDEDAESTPDAVPELVIYAVGCCFGRWDVRFATGGRQFGCLPGLFDPLPARAPGASDGPEPGIGILADDPGRKEDLGAELEAWFTGVFGESGHEHMQEAAEILRGSGASLRDWLRGGLFEFHVKQYSKKPRKAPMYWQLSVPSRRYSIWLYYHRLNRDTFWRVLNDFVKPKLSQEERRLAGLRSEAADAPAPSQRRWIQEQESFVAELGDFRADIETIAPIWNPNLNDGVLLNFAPLWKLVPQLPTWQRELRDCWQKLCNGDYDWAHTAIHLWPERVVPKCATDRSLAIAHGLEEAFWEKQPDGKWQAKKVSPAEMKALIDERSSKAVKAALDKLLAQSGGTDSKARSECFPEELMNHLAQHLVRQLERHLSERRVVVWYDPRREWESAFPEFAVEGKNCADLPVDALSTLTIGAITAQLAYFTGSFLQLRLLSEEVAASETPQPLVLYLPGESPDEENSVLMELEIGGKRWAPPLKRLAREVLKPYYVDGKIDELLDVATLTYADVVGWLEQAEEQAAGLGSMLKLVFPGLESAERILVEWLIRADRDTAIEEKNAASELRAHLAHRLGLGLPDSISLADARERMWRYLLVNEFRADLHCQPPSSLSLFPKPSTDGQMKTIRQLLSSLRRDHAEVYKSRADQVEQDLQLRHGGLAAADLGSVDTFRYEERALLAWCDRLLVEGRHEEALAILRARGSSFWVDQDLARKAQWAVCGRLVELGGKVAQVEKEVGGPARAPAAWVEAYTRLGGWWEIDQIHRQLDTLVAGLDDEPELGAALVLVRRKYESVVQKMAAGFTAAFKQAGWQIDGALPQASVYTQHVASAGTPVAYFLVDAMRYEMAQELAQQLASSAAVQVQPAIAAIPSITKIGMAALLPGASGSFTVTEEKGKLGARVDGSFLADWSARKKYWKARVPDMVELELGAVLELTPRKLQAKVTGAPMFLVRSSEIDELGESGQSQIARQVMATVLGNLVRAIRKLAAAGVPRFVLAADHGYQFVDEKGDEMKTDNPSGQEVELHRRCWVGRGGLNPPGTVRVTSAELGYEGSLEFVFPTGLGIFKAGGDLAYHHGGLSLQELVVPVVTVRVETARSEVAPARKVQISGAPSVLTTRTLGVKLTLDVGGLFETGEPVEIRPVLVAGGQEVGKAGMAVGADLDLNTQRLRLAPGQEVMVGLLLEREDATRVKVAVLDPRTGVVLGESAEIEVKLGI